MIIILLGLLGLALGSFVNALVWRLHEKETLKKSEKTKKRLNELSITKGRSMCPNCRHQLVWYDLLPVVSWLALRGKCRYCKKPISIQYPAVELLMALLLPVSFYFWPYDFQNWLSYVVFALWVITVPLLVALCVYDLKWMLMPNRLLYPAAALIFVLQLLHIINFQQMDILISSVVGSLLVGGFFWLVYQVSGGKWIGGGDVRYGFAMGLLLGWQKAIFGLMVASYAGTVLIIVIALLGKYHKRMKLPFAPFLISATYISLIFGQYFIDLYKRLSGL